MCYPKEVLIDDFCDLAQHNTLAHAITFDDVVVL